MKKQTRFQIYNDLANAVGQIRRGELVKRIGRKDGSIATHPIINVPNISEKIVLQDCLGWLKRKGIVANRMNVGAGIMSESGFHTYGIPSAGDIIGLNKHGIHFELECKQGKGGRLSVSQQKRMQTIQGSNGIYLIIHGWQELEHYNNECHYFD